MNEELEYEDSEYDTPTIPARMAFRRFWPLTRGFGNG